MQKPETNGNNLKFYGANVKRPKNHIFNLPL